MALGDYNNNKGYYNPTLYSNYKLSSQEGVDPSSLSPSYFNGMLKLSISPLKQNNGDKIAYDHDNAIAVFLTHTKARLFYNEIVEFLNNPNGNSSVGVNTGQDGLIMFSDGKELGTSNYCLIIRKIDPENGQIKSAYCYEFKTNYHYTIRNFDKDTSNFDKYYYDDIEIYQFLDLLKTYFESQTGAIAFSVMDGSKYDYNRTNTKIESIMNHLGIDYKSKSGNNNFNGSSYFNKPANNNSDSSSSTMRNSTLDDLDEEV